MAAQRDVGIPTWQDLHNLGDVHTEEELRRVLASPETANGILWVTPEVGSSDMIQKVEAPAIFERLDRGDGFFALLATAGGLSYRDAGAILDPFLGTHHVDERNCLPISEDPLTPGGAAQVARRLLRQRLRALHAVLPPGEPLRANLMTLRPASFEPARFELVLDWHERFDASTDHRAAPQETWNEHLLPALRTLREVLRAEVPGRRLVVSGLPSLPAALALGCTFSSLDRDLSVAWSQFTEGQEELWSLAETPEPVDFRVETKPSAVSARDLAVLLSVREDVADAFKRSELSRFRAVTKIQPPDRGKDTYPCDPLSAGQAGALADLVIREIRSARKAYKPERVHIFASIPSGLAMLLGQRLNTLGPVQTYEHLQDGSVGRYRPAAVLEAST